MNRRLIFKIGLVKCIQVMFRDGVYFFKGQNSLFELYEKNNLKALNRLSHDKTKFFVKRVFL